MLALLADSAPAQTRRTQWTVAAMRGILIVAALSTAHCPLFSQPGGYTTTDKGAIKKYESGAECMRMRKMDCALSEFTKAAQADEHFAEPRLMLAEMLEEQGKDAEAIARYREVLAISPALFPIAQLHLADLEFRSGQYPEAERNYREFLKKEDEPQRKARARLGIDNCVFAAEAIKQPVPFAPKNLGPGVNSAD